MNRFPFLLAAAVLLIAPALRAGNVINTLPNAASNERPLDLSSPHFATAFTTGSAPGKLGSITVKLRSITAANNARVQLWSSATSSSVPTDLVEDLGTLSIPISGDTDWTFTSTLAPQLDAGARYWVSVAYVTGGGTLYWKNATSSAATTSDSGASMADTRAGSNLAGTSWTFQTGTRTQLFSVTSVTERVVTNTDDTGTGSLREALAAAASAAGPDLITFDPALSGKTINLTSFTNHNSQANNNSALVITNDTGSVTIDATALPGGLSLSDNGNSNYRLLWMTGSTVTLRGLTFRDAGFTDVGNTSGGAIQAIDSVLTIERCTFSGNTGDGGGAIFTAGTSGNVTLRQCTFAGNSVLASGDGGAIFNYQNTMSLTHCTIVGNTSAAGAVNDGGIMNLDGTLTNTIVAGNTGGDVRIHTGTLICQGKNIIPNLTGTNSGSGSIDTRAPQLAGLAYYGGGTATIPPLAGSPAIDPSGGDSSSSFATDQRGQPRVVGGIADIGAVEYSATAAALSAVVVNNADSGLGSLVDTISAVPTGGTITFASALSGATISPASEITLDKNLTIDGTGLAIAPIISGTNSHRIFWLNLGITVALTRLTLQDGNAGGGDGGGISNQGTLTLTQCILSGNHADNSPVGGGGIFNDGTLTLNQSTLSGNHADNGPGGSGGGGIRNNGTLTLNQSTLSGNHADNSNFGGGGIYSAKSNDSITLTNSIIAGNTATGGSGPDVYNTGTPISTTGRNFIGDTAGSGLSASSSPLTTAQNGPASLAPLGNYGGPTPTMPPMAGQPGH